MTAKPRMTPMQAEATKPDLTAWVGASAGTGKTHVLTARVLRLMLSGTDPAKILCLTFTKAAASEMKTRIFDELGKWVRMDATDLAKEIHRRTDIRLEGEEINTARRLFAVVLELPGSLQIQTFHSFCQSLLGRFPLEAGLEPGFEALDDQLAAEVMREARDRTLSDALSPGREGLRSSVECIARHVSETTFDDLVKELDGKRQELAYSRKRWVNDTAFRQAIWQALDIQVGLTPARAFDQLVAYLISQQDDLRNLGQAMVDYGSKTNKISGYKLLDFCAAGDNPSGHLARQAIEVFLKKDGDPRANVLTKAVKNKAAGAEDMSLHLQASIYERSSLIAKATVAEATDALMVLALVQLDHYRQNKETVGKLDFSDMIAKTVGLLNQANIAPWILFKLDGGLDHILVDEAQDTNASQWTVIRELAGEFFGEHAEKPRTVFAVGDAKQSIYSFQGADPEQFLDARDKIFLQADNIGAPNQAIALNTSFRSGEAVLSLVDAVFHQEGRAWPNLTGDHEIIEHSFSRKGAGGLVEIWPLVTPQEKISKRPWEPPLVQERADDAADRLARQIADHIAGMIASKDLLDARGRPVRAGDIMVLVQRRSIFVEYLETALRKRRVPVAGRDRMILTEEMPVMDLIALGRFVLQPDDDLSLAEVLRSPLIGLTDEDLYTLAYRREGTLFKALKDSAGSDGFATALSVLLDCLRQAGFMSPFGFFSYVLNRLGGRMKLAERLGNEIDDVLDEFLEQALAYEKDHVPSLTGFLSVITRSNLQVKRDLEDAGDAVRVLTVHGAKGLEAPIVYMPDTVHLKTSGGRLHELGEDLKAPVMIWGLADHPVAEITEAKEDAKAQQKEEYRRLLYVAMTRAQDRLYVCGWETNKKRADDCWYDLIDEGFARLPTSDEMPDGSRRYKIRQYPPLPSQATVSQETPSPKGLPVWWDKPVPEEALPPRPLAPSRPSDSDVVALSPLQAADHSVRFARGLLVHNLLEWLPSLPEDIRKNRALAWLKKPAFDLSNSEAEALWLEVEAVLSNTAFVEVFSPHSRAEVPITGIVGDAVVSGQVDRLIVTDDYIYIVDYKTNRPPPQTVEQIDLGYIRQMSLYVSVLRQIWPDRTIRAGLLWTDTCDLMEIPVGKLSAG